MNDSEHLGQVSLFDQEIDRYQAITRLVIASRTSSAAIASILRIR